MADEYSKFPGSHQESIATVIALLDDDNSTLIANLVEVELLDEPFDDIVSRCISHRKQHKRPPGKGHVDDVFAHIFEDKDHKSYRQYDAIINKMVQQADRIDTGYVLSTVSDFIRIRKMRAGIAKAVEVYSKGGPGVFEELEAVFRDNLKIRDQQKDYGFSLADDRALGFLDRDARDYCNIGIKELDERGVVPTKKELLAFLSPPNRGKSAFLVHCGKFALLKGWRVAHYTLENSEDMTAQRYFMSLFNGVRRQGAYRYAAFEEDDGDSVRLRTETLTPDFIIENQDETITYLSEKMRYWRDKLANLRIRRFPSGRLSFEMLEQDLDEMAITHKFKPEMLLVDMPQLMKMSRRSNNQQDYSALDELVTNLRGLAVERNMAVVVPQQGNRSSNQAKSVQAQHGSGSFGIFGIADNLITYSQTPSEEKHGLARLYSQKVRNDRARQTIIITQHYDSGQFCMSSHPLDSQLADEVKRYTGYQEGEGGDDDEFDQQPGRQRARS